MLKFLTCTYNPFPEHAELFHAELIDGTVTVEGQRLNDLPDTVEFVIIEMRVRDARAILVLHTDARDPPLPDDVSFDKTLYGGTIEEGVVEHETITVSHYSGTDIEIVGG